MKRPFILKIERHEDFDFSRLMKIAAEKPEYINLRLAALVCEEWRRERFFEKSPRKWKPGKARIERFSKVEAVAFSMRLMTIEITLDDESANLRNNLLDQFNRQSSNP